MALERLPENIAQAFEQQARACASLGSPLTAAICDLIARNGLPKGRTQSRIASWSGDPYGTGTAIALRLAGALHNLVLNGADDGLTAVYPPNDWTEATLHDAVFRAIECHDDAICAFLDSPPQTNETGRAASLLPAFLQLASRHDMPMELLELGASAGLNQNLTLFHYDYGDWSWGNSASPLHLNCEWRGAPFLHSEPQLRIAHRSGCDISPVAISTEEDRIHLTSYVWADQDQRLQRIKAALLLAQSHPPIVEKSGAADWLKQKLQKSQTEGHWRVIFHTIMWQYMPAEERARSKATIQKAGEKSDKQSPLGWVRLEADGEKGSAGLYATVWDGGHDCGIDHLLARGDFHGRWIEWLD
ncbi:MAG: DUF2332 family protein [Pseudomonadota bacterium]